MIGMRLRRAGDRPGSTNVLATPASKTHTMLWEYPCQCSRGNREQRHSPSRTQNRSIRFGTVLQWARCISLKVHFLLSSFETSAVLHESAPLAHGLAMLSALSRLFAIETTTRWIISSDKQMAITVTSPEGPPIRPHLLGRHDCNSGLRTAMRPDGKANCKQAESSLTSHRPFVTLCSGNALCHIHGNPHQSSHSWYGHAQMRHQLLRSGSSVTKRIRTASSERTLKQTPNPQ